MESSAGVPVSERENARSSCATFVTIAYRRELKRVPWKIHRLLIPGVGLCRLCCSRENPSLFFFSFLPSLPPRFSFLSLSCLFNFSFTRGTRQRRSTCPVGFNLKFVRFISLYATVAEGRGENLHARMKLLTFTAGKRRRKFSAQTKDLSAEPAYSGGGRERENEVFSRGCHSSALRIAKNPSNLHRNCCLQFPSFFFLFFF